MARVEGLSVAVTGGARGIGLAIARGLSARGARVAIGDLDAAAVATAAERLPRDGIGVPLDVTDGASFEAFLDAAGAAHGPLDVLVNNAGIMWVGPFAEEREATAQAQFGVNLHGTVRGMKLAIPRMLARGKGQIVNVASAASKVAPAGEATYAATKHAVYGYSAAVRAELRDTPIEISVVMPAVVETELARGTSAGRVKRLAPEDVADAVVKAVEKPRFDVFVPANIAYLTRFVAVLPPRARDWVTARLVPDQLQLTDREARRAYEDEAMGGGRR